MNGSEILEGKKILLCEDHPINSQIVKALLEKQGMAVDTADNGQIGLEMFTRSQLGEYAAILMDLKMPVMDGIETTKAIRALGRADAGSVPIVAMTASEREQDIRQALDAGMDRYMVKPVSPKPLYGLLAELILEREEW